MGAGDIRAGGAYVEFSADTVRLMQSFRDLETSAKSTGAKIAEGLDGGGGMAASVMSGLRFARGAGAVMVASRVAGSAGTLMSTIAAIRDGNAETFREFLFSLPIIGDDVRKLADGFDDLFLGIRAGMKAMQEEAMKDLKYVQNNLKVTLEAQDIRDETGMMGLSGSSLGRARASLKAGRELDKLEADAAAAGGNINEGVWKDKNQAITERLFAEIAAIDRAVIDARIDATLKEEDDALTAAAKAFRADEDASEQWATERGVAEYQSVIDGLDQVMARERQAAALMESTMTPEQQFRKSIMDAEDVLSGDDLTKYAEVQARKAAQAIIAADRQPDLSTSGAGTFNAFAVRGLEGGGMPRLIKASEETAREAAEMRRLLTDANVYS